MAATLDQIISSLQSVYQPQLDSISQQQAALPAQYDAQAQGIDAQKNDAFNQITNTARQRGVGFSGIPLQEQAQYTAGTYAPALANLRTSQNQQGQSLIDALNKINENKFNTANSLYQFGANQDYQQQQLAEQQREFDAQQATARAAAAGAYNPTYGATATPTTPQGSQKADPYAKIDKNGAMNALNSLIKTNNMALINQTYNAIKKSASYGNVYDQYKLQLINAAMQPTNNAAYNPAVGNLLKGAINYKTPSSSSKSYPTASSTPNPADLIRQRALLYGY